MQRFALLGLVLVGACGSDTSFVDASVPTADGPPADPHGIINVTVLTLAGDGLPQVGATVQFTDGDGTRVALTDASGKASATILPDASVTVVRLNTGGSVINTVLGVAPGDSVLLGNKAGTSTVALGTATVTHTPFATAAGYLVYQGCGTSGIATVRNTGAVSVADLCADGSDDVLVTAQDAAGVIVASAATTGVALTVGATIAVPDDKPADAWQAAGTFNATYAGLPPEAKTVRVARTNLLAGKQYASPSATLTPTGTDGAISVKYPVFGDSMVVATTVGGATAGTSQAIRERRAVADQYALTMPDVLLPWLANLAFDPATSTITWAAAGPGTPDGAMAVLIYSIAATEQTHRWIVTAPPGATSVKLPALPASVGPIAPTAEARVTSAAVLVESDQLDGYAALRQQPELGLTFATDSAVAGRQRISIITAAGKK